jgi:UDP-glucose 4-epimerase
VARGLELLVGGGAANQTINLAYGQGNTLVAMAETIGAALGVAPRLMLAPPRVGEVTHYVADIARARALLGYAPRVPLEEGIPRAVAWATDYWTKH